MDVVNNLYLIQWKMLVKTKKRSIYSVFAYQQKAISDDIWVRLLKLMNWHLFDESYSYTYKMQGSI